MIENLDQTYCTVPFDEFFNSPMLIDKLFDKGIYAVEKVRSNRKQMPQMKNDKQTRWCWFQVLWHCTTLKWYDNKSILLLANNIEEIDTCSTVQRRMKGSSSKISIACPSLVKFNNKSMGGVDFNLRNKKLLQIDLVVGQNTDFIFKFSLI